MAEPRMVYVLTEANHDGSEVRAVFADKETAEAHARRAGYEVEEYPLWDRLPEATMIYFADAIVREDASISRISEWHTLRFEGGEPGEDFGPVEIREQGRGTIVRVVRAGTPVAMHTSCRVWGGGTDRDAVRQGVAARAAERAAKMREAG